MEAFKTGRAFVVDNLSPVNTLFFFATGILIPAMDLLRPQTFFLAYAAGVAALFFVAIVALRLLGKPRPEAISKAFVTTVGLCAGLIAISAVASTGHANGFLASKSESLRDVQASLLGLTAQTASINNKLDSQLVKLEDIRMGKSADPRVELHNLGVAWERAQFYAAIDRGDVRVVKLFLAGGMPTKSSNRSELTAPAWAVQRNVPHIAEQLRLFQQFGFDLHDENAVGLPPDVYLPSNLYGLAVEKKNTEAAALLAEDPKSVARYKGWKAWQLTELPKVQAANREMFFH